MGIVLIADRMIYEWECGRDSRPLIKGKDHVPRSSSKKPTAVHNADCRTPSVFSNETIYENFAATIFFGNFFYGKIDAEKMCVTFSKLFLSLSEIIKAH